MNWRAYSIAAEDRATIGRLLLERFRGQEMPVLALAVCETNFHAMLQIRDPAPKRILGFAKRHVTFEYAAIIDPSTNKREQIWEGGARGKPLGDRGHAVEAFEYILKHIRGGGWVWSYRDDREYARTLARTIADGGRGGTHPSAPWWPRRSTTAHLVSATSRS
jgi:hypothetical protein